MIKLRRLSPRFTVAGASVREPAEHNGKAFNDTGSSRLSSAALPNNTLEAQALLVPPVGPWDSASRTGHTPSSEHNLHPGSFTVGSLKRNI